jgi:hypothetical protein
MVTTPRAIDSRNAVFITDHGSMRVSRRRARRGGRLGRDARAGRFLAGAGAGCGGPGRRPGAAARDGPRRSGGGSRRGRGGGRRLGRRAATDVESRRSAAARPDAPC